MRRESLTVVVCATILALTFALGWVPYGGIFLIPILFAACCFDYKLSLASSLMFGIVSLIYAFTGGSATIIGGYFITYPWMPIVPRLFIGPVAHSVYLIMKKLIKEKGIISKIIPISVASAAGALTNTALVGLCITIVEPFYSSVNKLAFIELVGFGLMEMGIVAAALPPLVLVVKKALPKLFAEINEKKQPSVNQSVTVNQSTANQDDATNQDAKED